MALNNYRNTLEELYHHPLNGSDEPVFIAAFEEVNRTFPIYVTSVERRLSGEGYVAKGIGYKWGFDSPDTMTYDWYDDAQLQRDTYRQFFSAETVPSLYKSGRPHPFHPLPLTLYQVFYFKNNTEDAAWQSEMLVNATSKAHAEAVVRQSYPEAHDFYFSKIDLNTVQSWELAE